MNRYGPEPGDYEAAVGAWFFIAVIVFIAWIASFAWLVTR